MKKKISVLLVVALLVFAFFPALTLAQEDLDNGEQDTVVEETEETIDDNEEEATDDSGQEDEDETEESYKDLDELLAALEANEDLSSVEKVTLERKLTEYDDTLNIDSISSVVDKILNEDLELGEGFVILRNLEESVSNGFAEERAMELINNYEDQDDSGQFAFQTALELRKLSREDISGESSAAFADEVASIIEEKGEIETSELKQLAAEYRKEAREEKREKMKADREKEENPASPNSFAKANNASENAVNKDNNGNREKGNSNNSKSKSKAKGKDKPSNNSGNSSSNSNKNSKK
jgi:hypothetical protein